MNSITEVTFNDIVAIVKYGSSIPIEYEDLDLYDRPIVNVKYEDAMMTFCGKLDEIDFLKRVFDIKNLPSMDSRFENAEGDIWQHTINNDDFEPFWFFDYEPFAFRSDDEKILKFICEMFHPAVRKENEPWNEFLNIINDLLKHDGYEIYSVSRISGRDVYGWRTICSNSVKTSQIKAIKEAFSSSYIDKQIELMNGYIEENPTEAIGKAKELCESCCKTVLLKKGITVDRNWDVPRLTKETCKILKLTPDDIDDSKKASDTIKAILGNLSAITKGVAELRNPYGSGHGKESAFKSLSSRHAGLAVGAAVTFVHFIWETYLDREEISK